MITNPKKNETKLAIEEETVFEEEPAVKVKVEIPERAQDDEAGRDNTEIPEIVVSDDEELNRSLVEQIFVSNIEQQACCTHLKIYAQQLRLHYINALG